MINVAQGWPFNRGCILGSLLETPVMDGLPYITRAGYVGCWSFSSADSVLSGVRRSNLTNTPSSIYTPSVIKYVVANRLLAIGQVGENLHWWYFKVRTS